MQYKKIKAIFIKTIVYKASNSHNHIDNTYAQVFVDRPLLH